VKSGCAILVAILATGCVQQVVRREPRPPVSREHVDLQAAGIRTIAVIEALDRTDQGAGLPVAKALRQSLEAGWVPVHTEIVRRPGANLARSWLVALARRLGVEAFVTGTVSAYAAQEAQERAFVVMTALLLDQEGRILWSRRASGAAPLAGQQMPLSNEGYLGNNGTSIKPGIADGSHDALFIAASIAAKEFVHDLAPAPPP